MESKTAKGAILLLTGAALGAAAGLLLAPESGKKTRERLSDWLKQRKDMRDILRTKTERFTHAIAAGRKAYHEDKVPTEA